MFSCNCLNIVVTIERNEKITKEALELTVQEKAEAFFNQDQWYAGKLININKVHPGLIRSKRVGLWTITHCLNCEVQTHAIHKDKGASYVLFHSKLLNQEAINNVKSSDLVSTIFQIIVNPNGIGPDNSDLDTYRTRNVDKIIKDFNDLVRSYTLKEQAAVEERIKRYSDEQYELLNVLKDKAYKEREALVRIVQNAALEDSAENQLSPKSPKGFGIVLTDKHSASNSPSDSPFSPKRPKSTLRTDREKEDDFREDFIFDFETDEFSENRNTNDSDSEEIEEAEDIVSEATGIAILHGHGRSARSRSNIAKSCPVDIPIFSQSSRSKNGRSDAADSGDEFSRPSNDEQFDIAASIKALARSVHGDAIFGDLPRPKFSTQI